jgi:hypothetical protein
MIGAGGQAAPEAVPTIILNRPTFNWPYEFPYVLTNGRIAASPNRAIA